jgi:ribosome-associated protein
MERSVNPLGTHKQSGVTDTSAQLKDLITEALDANKAEEIEVINLIGQTSIADYMVIATGTSSRQVAALADKIDEKLKDTPFDVLRTEGLPTADWVVVDCGDVIVHLFRPEVRAFYAIEKMWQLDLPTSPENPAKRISRP